MLVTFFVTPRTKTAARRRRQTDTIGCPSLRILGAFLVLGVACAAPDVRDDDPTVGAVERTDAPDEGADLGRAEDRSEEGSGVDAAPLPPPIETRVRRPDEMLLRVRETVNATSAGAWVDEPPTLRLTLERCRLAPFEVADVPHGGRCASLNQQHFDDRSQRALRVPAGALTVSVENRSGVEGGLWIRRDGDPLQSAFSAGGARVGETTHYSLRLEPGTYHVSCPLTPTPDYLLIVEAR